MYGFTIKIKMLVSAKALPTGYLKESAITKHLLKRQCAVYEAVQIRMFTYVIINCVMGTRKSAFFVARIWPRWTVTSVVMSWIRKQYESEEVIFHCALIWASIFIPLPLVGHQCMLSMQISVSADRKMPM